MQLAEAAVATAQTNYNTAYQAVLTAMQAVITAENTLENLRAAVLVAEGLFLASCAVPGANAALCFGLWLAVGVAIDARENAEAALAVAQAAVPIAEANRLSAWDALVQAMLARINIGLALVQAGIDLQNCELTRLQNCCD